MIKGLLNKALMSLVVLVAFSPVQAQDAELVRSGDIVITESDFHEYVNYLIPAEEASRLLSDKAWVRKIVLDMFSVQYLVSEARQQGIDQRPEIQFKAENIVKRELVRALLEHMVIQEKMPDFEPQAKENYLGRKPEFVTPERISASHILVAVNADRDEQEALMRAKTVFEKAKQGTAFVDLVAEYSDDPSAARNAGELPAFGRGEMVKPFEDFAFSMVEPGQISPPVKTSFGFHIIQLHKRIESRQLTFDEVKDQLIDELKADYIRRLKQEKLAEPASAPGLMVNSEAIDSLVKATPEPTL